jgi:hypothetical protein
MKSRLMSRYLITDRRGSPAMALSHKLLSLGAIGLLLLAGIDRAQAAPVQRLAVKAFGDKDLCRAMVFDESTLPADADYTRDTISDALNADMPQGSEVVSLHHVIGDMEATAHPMDSQSTDFENAATKVTTLDLLNTSKPQNVYHLSGSSHYFAGDIFIVTDQSIPERTVAPVIDAMASPSGDLDEAQRVAKAHGWLAFTGGQTFYASVRYTGMSLFQFKNTAYLVSIGMKPGPVAVVSKPLPNGQLKTMCLFYAAKP